MLVLCTWNDEPETVHISLNTDALAFEPGKALDAETGKPLELKGNRLTMNIEGHGVRVVRLEK
jgi:hypothetical protein